MVGGLEQIASCLRHLRKAVGESDSDSRLLERFVRDRDAQAFEAIVHRHGPMVLAVCRRSLQNASEADDLFQAAFLILLRKAATLRDQESLACWLHGVAHRLALNSNRESRRRQNRLREMIDMSVKSSRTESDPELGAILDEEIARLPIKYREPFVLCCLEGRSQEEAAQAIGCPRGTVAGRLARSRDQLRQRLARRGIGESAALGALLGPVLVPRELRALAVQSALHLADGKLTAISSSVMESVYGGLRDMAAMRIKWAVLLGILCLMVTAGALGAKALHGEKEQQAEPKVEPIATGMKPIVPTGHGHAVTSVALSTDGKLAITGSQDRTAILWDVETEKLLFRLEGHAGEVMGVALSADGKRAITGSTDKTAIVWDTATGRKLRTLEGHTKKILSVALTADGKRAITGSWDSTAIIWDTEKGEKIHALERHGRGVHSVDISADGQVAVTSSSDRYAIVWDVPTGMILHKLKGHNHPITQIALSTDGKRAITSSLDGTAIVWDADKGEELHTLKAAEKALMGATLSADGKRAITCSLRNEVILWNAESGEQLRAFEGDAESPSLIIAGQNSTHPPMVLSADGTSAMIATSTGSVRLWNSTTGKPTRTLTNRPRWWRGVSASDDGRRIVTVAENNTVTVWDASVGRKSHSFIANKVIITLAVSADGRRAVANLLKGEVVVWDFDKKESRVAIDDCGEFIRGMALSADGKRAIVGMRDRSVSVCDLDSRKAPRRLDDQTGHAACVAISADGRRVIAGTNENVAILWETASRQQIRTFKGHVKPVLRVALSADGQRALTASHDHVAIAWDSVTGNKLHVWDRLEHEISEIALSPDGRTTFLGLSDNTVRVFDTESGKQLRTLAGHHGPINTIGLLDQGKRAVTSSRDGTIRFWDTTTGTELCAILCWEGCDQLLVITPDGLYDGPAEAAKLLGWHKPGSTTRIDDEATRKSLHRPGLLGKLLNGERP